MILVDLPHVLPHKFPASEVVFIEGLLGSEVLTVPDCSSFMSTFARV